MNRADYNVGNLESEIKVQFEQAVSALNQTITALDSIVSLLKGTNSQLNKMNFGDAFKSTVKLGVIAGGLRKGFNTVKDITSASIDMIETTNLFEVQMGKVVDEYGNLDEAQSQYYTKAMAFQDKMNEKLATNKSEMQKYQAMYYGMLNSQLGSSNRGASYLISESLTKAGYDIASLYNLNVEDAMNKLKSGLAGQIESLRQIGIDVSEASLAKVLNEVGIDRSVQQLSYAEKEVARYIAIVEQAGKAQGDFARTFESPANQLRIFQNQLMELKQVAGSFFVGLFGQIVPVVNGIIMAIKEILKALGSVFGFKIDTGNSSLSGVSDTIGDIDSGIGSATKKAKEFKKQLMGFDEINNITPPSESSGGSGGGTATGVDSALLNALKEWDNKMDSISGKAQEIRDKILDWLGVTDGSYKNLKKILEIAKLVGITIGTWKIASTVSNFLKSWGKLSKTQAFQLATGITLTVTGLVAQFNGTKQLINGNWSLFNLIETALGTAGGALGIVSIMKALKLGTKLNLGQKLAIGFGIMLEVQGIQVAYDAIKKLKDGSLETNEALEQLVAGIAETAGAGAMLGSAFGGIGAIIGGLGGAFVGAFSALYGYNQEVDEVQQKIDEMNQKLAEQHTAMENYVTDLANQRQAIQDTANSKLEEIDISQQLLDELKKIVDENGNIKDGYEDRVAFITGQLKEAYGIEAELINGQIKNYDELTQQIQKAIDKKRAEVLLEAKKEEYTIAIQNQTKAYEEYQKALEEATAVYKQLNEKTKQYNALLEFAQKTGQIDKYSGQLGNLCDEILTLKEQYKTLSDTTIGYRDEFKRCTEDIIEYEDLYTATLKGDTEEVNRLVQEQTRIYETENGKQKQSLENQAQMEKDIATVKKDMYQQLGKDISAINNDTNEAMLQNLKENLIKQSQTVESITPEIVKSWDTLGNLSYSDFTDALNKIPVEAKNKITEMSSVVRLTMRSESVETRGVFSNISLEFNRAFNSNLDGEGSARDYVRGINRGITNNKNTLYSTITGLASSVSSWFKNTLGIRSPSRVMMNISKYIPEGIAKGIDDNSYQAIKSAKDMAINVSEAVSSNTDTNVFKGLEKGIKVNTGDFAVDTNQYVNYSAVKGQILAQSQIDMNDNIAERIADAVTQSMRNAEVNVNIEARADEGVIVKKVSNGFREYVMQTGELPFPVPI